MSNTGYEWSAFEATQESGTDWTAEALTDGNTDTSDVIDCSGKASIELGVQCIATGAVSGVLTIYILREVASSVFESTLSGNPYSFTFDPLASGSSVFGFFLSMAHYDRIKLALKNNAGTTLTNTVKHKFATVPVAS